MARLSFDDLCYLLYNFSKFVEVDNNDFEPEHVLHKNLSLKLHLRLHILFLLRIERPDAPSDGIPDNCHFQQYLRRVALCSTPKLLVLQSVPSLLAVLNFEQRNCNLAQKLHLVIPILVVHGDLDHVVYVTHVECEYFLPGRT